MNSTANFTIVIARYFQRILLSFHDRESPPDASLGHLPSLDIAAAQNRTSPATKE